MGDEQCERRLDQAYPRVSPVAACHTSFGARYPLAFGRQCQFLTLCPSPFAAQVCNSAGPLRDLKNGSKREIPMKQFHLVFMLSAIGLAGDAAAATLACDAAALQAK